MRCSGRPALCAGPGEGRRRGEGRGRRSRIRCPCPPPPGNCWPGLTRCGSGGVEKAPAGALKASQHGAALKHGFVQTEDDLFASAVDTTLSGTTAVAVLLRGRSMLLANTGDSRAVLGRREGHGVAATALTKDHKPEDGAERARIERMHGTCQQMYDPEFDEFIGPVRVWSSHYDGKSPGIAMSRSIGDMVRTAGQGKGVCGECGCWGQLCRTGTSRSLPSSPSHTHTYRATPTPAGRHRGRRYLRAGHHLPRRGPGPGRGADHCIGRRCVCHGEERASVPRSSPRPSAPIAVWEFMSDQDAVDLAMQHEGRPRDAAVALCQESLRRWREVSGVPMCHPSCGSLIPTAPRFPRAGGGGRGRHHGSGPLLPPGGGGEGGGGGRRHAAWSTVGPLPRVLCAS